MVLIVLIGLIVLIEFGLGPTMRWFEPFLQFSAQNPMMMIMINIMRLTTEIEFGAGGDNKNNVQGRDNNSNFRRRHNYHTFFPGFDRFDEPLILPLILPLNLPLVLRILGLIPPDFLL